MAMEQSSCLFNAFIVFLLIILEEAIALLSGQIGPPAAEEFAAVTPPLPSLSSLNAPRKAANASEDAIYAWHSSATRHCRTNLASRE
jgi:hypothetical protein